MSNSNLLNFRPSIRMLFQTDCLLSLQSLVTTLDKILYIADYIEPRRDKADNLPQMRYLAFQDLDETMYEILKGTLEYLDKKGNTIDPMTLQAYEYFTEVMKQKKANMHI